MIEGICYVDIGTCCKCISLSMNFVARTRMPCDTTRLPLLLSLSGKHGEYLVQVVALAGVEERHQA